MIETKYQQLEQAAHWFVILNDTETPPSKAQRAEFEYWLGQGEHEQAWRDICKVHNQCNQLSQPLPANSAGAMLSSPPDQQRRALLKMALLLPTTGYLGWQGAKHPWTQQQILLAQADQTTAVGESRVVDVAKDTQVWLNTNTGVDILQLADISQISLLTGELFIKRSTGADRPIHVVGQVHDNPWTVSDVGLGCSAFQELDHCKVNALNGNLTVQFLGRSWLVPHLHSAVISNRGVSIYPHVDQPHWHKGELWAQDIPLQTFISDLKRYYRGKIFVEDSANTLNLAGVFPAFDIAKTLAMLQQSLPIKVRQLGNLAIFISRKPN